VGLSTGDFERWLKEALEVGLCEGNVEGGLPCWGTWRIGRKALVTGVSIGAPLGNLEGCSSTGNFERWM
jgi:hypothetical protein